MREPKSKLLECSGNQASWLLEIDPAIDFFQGHFPEHAILPGVVQTQWAIEFGQKNWPIRVECSALKQIKFKELILPDMTVKLELELNLEKSQLKYRYVNDHDIELSSGIIESVHAN